MRNILFTLLLFTSCSNVSTVTGQLENFTYTDGRATFTLGGQKFSDVGILPSSATTMGNFCGMSVEVGFSGDEITHIYPVKNQTSFDKWALRVIGITLAIGLLLSQLPEKYTNPYSTTQGGNYGRESWWSNRL